VVLHGTKYHWHLFYCWPRSPRQSCFLGLVFGGSLEGMAGYPHLRQDSNPMYLSAEFGHFQMDNPSSPSSDR
jgi:hypothetical protein